jgi:hypothetical protein
MPFIFFTQNTGTNGTGVRTQVPIEGLKWESECRTLKTKMKIARFYHLASKKGSAAVNCSDRIKMEQNGVCGVCGETR